MGLGIVELRFGLADELVLFCQVLEEGLTRLSVGLGRGTTVMIERHSKILEGCVDLRVVAIYDFLWVYAFTSCPKHDRDSMFIGAAYKSDVSSEKSLIAAVDIPREIRSSKVADVQRSVGVGQGGGH
jgi:hypothetical protein